MVWTKQQLMAGKYQFILQICNWFANWRRKLKNAGSEVPHHTWGNLIKCYNTKAQGNVEQFSLCSDDSIWEEQDISDRGKEQLFS